MRQDDELLRRIARYLMLHGSFTNNIGLLNGKTGIAVFFYHYSRHTGKEIYDGFAGELIDEIYREIHINTTCDFGDGLCGIGWGIEYLIRNGFVNADPDEVLEDLDRQILERDVRRITDNSLETGLKGIACYAISRRENRSCQNSRIGKEYIQDLIEALGKAEEKDKETTYLTENLEKIVREERTANSYNPVFERVNQIKYNAKSLFEKETPIGIDKNGYAGIGLQLMKPNKRD